MKKIGTLLVAAACLLFVVIAGCPRPSEMMEPEDPDSCGGGREGKMAMTFRVDTPPEGSRPIDLTGVASVMIEDASGKTQQIAMPRVERSGDVITVFLDNTKIHIRLK